jgi:hypothetical protein
VHSKWFYDILLKSFDKVIELFGRREEDRAEWKYHLLLIQGGPDRTPD